MNNMYYYRYYFRITEGGLHFKKSIDANNPQSAYMKVKHDHPYADEINLISSGKRNDIKY